MTSAEFLYDLRKRLNRLPQQEIDQAMAYYEEYFAEVGPGGEAELISRLGTPAQVAASIISEYAMKDMSGKSQAGKGASSTGKKDGGLKTMWIVIIAAMASPIAIPLAIALFAVVFALLIALFSVLLSLFVTAVAMVVAGIAGAIFGVIGLFTQPLEAIALLGYACVSTSLGVALFLGATKLSKLSIKGITWIFARLLGRKGGQR